MSIASGSARRSLGLIHTVTGLVPVFEALLARHLPGWKPFNIVDESLLRNTIGRGELTPATMRRVAGHVWSASDAGAEAILVTCSSIGPAVDAVAPFSAVPVVRVDVGMAEKALDIGTRIGVLATLATTLKPTSDLVRMRASMRASEIELTSYLCEGAFDRLSAGDKAGHDAAIVAGVQRLADQVDVIVLAQASMARALEGEASEGLRIPVLSSPELGVLHLEGRLSGRIESASFDRAAGKRPGSARPFRAPRPYSSRNGSKPP